jgi:hypothetical protein
VDLTADDDDAAFHDVYGDWDPLSLTQVQALLRGFGHPWWVIGGHAIEAFTGISRVHDDIDISFFPGALQDFRGQLEGQYHLWSNHGGTFRHFDAEHPEPLDPLAQVWVRRDARSPWVLDISPSPSVAGQWQSKRDSTHTADLDEVTWVNGSGVRFLNPEIVLLFKAAQDRARDRADLRNTWPLLSSEKRDWLKDALRRFDPAHAWNAELVTL